MKILAITAFYPPHHSGGYELRCKEVLEGLEQRGHSVVILTTRCPQIKCDLHSLEIGVERILPERQASQHVFMRIINDCIDLRQIDKTVKHYAPDLIYLWHIQNLSNSILPYFSSRSIPIVYDEGGSGLIYLSKIQQRGLYFYQNEQDQFLKKLLKKMIYQVARIASFNLINPNWHWPDGMRIYFNSQSSKANAINHGVKAEEAAVIPSGVDIQNFPFRSRASIGKPIRIVVPSRIKAEKGVKDAIYLAMELIKNGLEIKMTIIGKVQSTEYFDELLQLVETNGLNKSISFVPMVDQKALSQIYQENDFCFFPSYFRSGFSRVPLEAMASGCVVITYGNEGSSEVINHTENGIQISEGDINLAVSWIVRLQKEPSTYRKIVTAAKKHIDEEYNFKDYVNRIESFLIG